MVELDQILDLFITHRRLALRQFFPKLGIIFLQQPNFRLEHHDAVMRVVEHGGFYQLLKIRFDEPFAQLLQKRFKPERIQRVCSVDPGPIHRPGIIQALGHTLHLRFPVEEFTAVQRCLDQLLIKSFLHDALELGIYQLDQRLDILFLHVFANDAEGGLQDVQIGASIRISRQAGFHDLALQGRG